MTKLHDEFDDDFEDGEPAIEGERIGDLLVAGGFITKGQLDTALAAQRHQGGRVGQHLIAMGALTRKELYSGLAQQVGLPYVDLAKDPGDTALLGRVDGAELVHNSWMPYRLVGDHLTVALKAAPGEHVRHEAHVAFPEATSIDMVVVSDWDFDGTIHRFIAGRPPEEVPLAERLGRPLGTILMESGLIKPDQLEDALKAQARDGGQLGQHLVLSEDVSRLELYRSLAQQLGFPFVDLIADPPDVDLMERVDPRVQSHRQWIPYRLDGDRLVIATKDAPTRHMIREAQRQFDVTRIDIVITTDWDLDRAITRYCRGALLFSAAEELAFDRPEASAKGKPVPWQRVFVYIVGISLVAGFVFRPFNTIIAILVIVNVFFFLSILFKVVTTLIGLVVLRDRQIEERQLAEAGVETYEVDDDANLPIYTILVPVFHESNVIELVIEHIGTLDWPKSKLQVLILTEEVDEATIQACKDAGPPEYVRLLVVPAGTPQTKPRACNFGLMFALGEYLVIFDAEDRPEPDQLRRAHAAFVEDEEKGDPNRPLACVQSALNYFNWDANVLTRMFTLEYSSWFDGMLHGIEALKMPIPLGGTSNHFRTDRLRELGGWDPYNVTEDADLGMRAAAAGFRVSTINSTTWEEACARVPAFIKQRTRWIKGYMITTLVDARYPVRFTRSAGWRSIVTLVGLIFGTPFAFLAYPVVWGITIAVYLGVETTNFSLPPALGTFAVINAIGGNLAVLTLSMITGSIRHGWRIAGYALLNPFYWCLHSIAAWRALYQVFFNPFHWEKTPHGLTLGEKEVSAHVT